MIWNRVERTWIFQIDIFIFIRFLDSRLKSVFVSVTKARISNPSSRYFFNRRRGGSERRPVCLRRHHVIHGFFVAWNTEIQALFPSETAAITTEHSVTLLLCGGVIICLCLGHGSISRGAIELAESKELRLRINHGMNRRARSWFKSHLRFSIIIVVFGEKKINCAWKNICCWRFCKESLGLLWL